MSKTKQLRFAGLVRVSGEAQAKHGESLRTQHGQLENAVGQMQARVTRWYEGQEHATPGHERQLLEQMLKDAAKAKSPFDAIVVADPTRWTRDNQRGDSGLDHLRQHGIRFFVLSQEFNLYDPVHRFMLQQFASFGELSAALNLQKAMDNRIARAKRNVPTNGSLPWGRTFDRATETWGIDEEKQRIIKDIAARYIRGESRVKLAAEYGLEQTGLHDVLTKKCGSEWPIQFMCKRLNIDEEVMLTIPALLPATTRKAILRRAEKNRTSDLPAWPPCVPALREDRELFTGTNYCRTFRRSGIATNVRDVWQPKVGGGGGGEGNAKPGTFGGMPETANTCCHRA